MKRKLEEEEATQVFEQKQPHHTFLSNHNLRILYETYGCAGILYSFHTMDELCAISVVLGETVWRENHHMDCNGALHVDMLFHLAEQQLCRSVKSLCLSHVFGDVVICSAQFPILKTLSISKSWVTRLEVQTNPLMLLELCGVCFLSVRNVNISSEVSKVCFSFVTALEGSLDSCLETIRRVQALEITGCEMNQPPWNAHPELTRLHLNFGNICIPKPIHIRDLHLESLAVIGQALERIPSRTVLKELNITNTNPVPWGPFPVLEHFTYKGRTQSWVDICNAMDHTTFSHVQTLFLDIHHHYTDAMHTLVFSCFPMVKDVQISFRSGSGVILSNGPTVESLRVKFIFDHLNICSFPKLRHVELESRERSFMEQLYRDLPQRTVVFTEIPELQTLQTCSEQHYHILCKNAASFVRTSINECEVMEKEKANLLASTKRALIEYDNIKDKYKRFVSSHPGLEQSMILKAGPRHKAITLLHPSLQVQTKQLLDATKFILPTKFGVIRKKMNDFLGMATVIRNGLEDDTLGINLLRDLRANLNSMTLPLYHMYWWALRVCAFRKDIQRKGGSLQLLNKWGILEKAKQESGSHVQILEQYEQVQWCDLIHLFPQFDIF